MQDPTTNHDYEPPVQTDDLYFDDATPIFTELLAHHRKLATQLHRFKSLHDDITQLDSIGAANLQPTITPSHLKITVSATVSRLEGVPREILDRYDWQENTITYNQEQHWFSLDLTIRFSLQTNSRTQSD